MFKKVLVANRGEIAVRVMRTLRDLGISPLAIYSEADQHALHVRMADDARCVGPAPSRESYLKMDAVLEAARSMGADAIHPGYGFLSENAVFAQRVVDAGFVWIGPSPHSIESMGDKLLARRTVKAANVPVVPGVVDAIHDHQEAIQIAREIGYPIMLKASAGGGGKGMRRVENEEHLIAALEAAQREALGAFGDSSVYVEKWVDEPHHIEIQVMCDQHGNAFYVGERECSVQRRHQKVVEECPSPFISHELRRKMGEVAVNAARSCQYVGAGTVEFLVSGKGEFYFLEMNTRLQVEHPVTELVYGLDLVEAQLRVAMGEVLNWKQEDLIPKGHAIECRIYAEDPKTYLPCPGKLHLVRWPQGPGVRVDTGVETGAEVSMNYDPMVAKICTYGQDRAQAIRRMHRALEETTLLGITHNIPLHHQVLAHPRFLAGNYDTSLLGTPLPEQRSMANGWMDAVLAAAAIARYEQDLKNTITYQPQSQETPWRLEGHQRMMRGG